MTTRPTPRKSSLAGSSPVTLVTEPAVEPAGTGHRAVDVTGWTPGQAADDVEVEQVVEAKEAEKGAQQQPAKAKTKYPPKVSFYQDPEDTARVRGAILHTMTTEGSRSLSLFIHHAVMAEVERLEAKYNGGRPFPPVGVRELPQGRLMGE